MEDDQNAVEDTPTVSDAVDGQPTEVPVELQRLQEVLDANKLTDADAVQSFVDELGKYKQNFGNSQNEVGELRRQVQALQEQQQQQPEDQYTDQKPWNLKKEIQEAFGEMITNYQQAQTRGQQQYAQQMIRLQQMPNWSQVEGEFNKAMQNPQVQQAMQTGQTDMEKVYLHLNNNYLLSVAKGAQTAIDKIPENARRTLTTPPATTGDGRVAQPPSDAEERRANIEKAKENLDAQGVLQNMLPDGDPMLR